MTSDLMTLSARFVCRSLLKRASRHPELVSAAAIDQFVSIFNAHPRITRGSELLLSLGGDAATGSEVMRVYWNGQLVLTQDSASADAKSKGLGWAVFDMYCGSTDPISWDIRDHFQRGFAARFGSTKKN